METFQKDIQLMKVSCNLRSQIASFNFIKIFIFLFGMKAYKLEQNTHFKIQEKLLGVCKNKTDFRKSRGDVDKARVQVRRQGKRWS